MQLSSLKCFLEKTALIHENQFGVCILSYSISHLESCVLCAALFKDLYLSGDVPSTFILNWCR